MNGLQSFNAHVVIINILTGAAVLCLVRHSSFIKLFLRKSIGYNFGQYYIWREDKWVIHDKGKASTSLEIVVLELFESHGWDRNNRIC